ncbi:polyketide synthase [Longimycelium tulufanense]|uniref:Polyketide synthase n=1 Tax=Longimycelium tulufanense TaxID=907463 RepID=A0A8J3CKY1_9PSEU|nr:beta-ketoacyl synthase N-terminal-like domain-containing protein [Longimycelium tulufanense]GGM84546.1 polyketide synthase [Longimycelium tulufanense]
MTPIAIVGMGAIFPGAGTARQFWQNIRAGTDAITDVPPHRWDPEIYYAPHSYADAPRSDRIYCCRGGFIDDLATFDPLDFGIMPATVEGIEPDQLLALRTAAEAIADAGGIERLPDRLRIGVVIGRGGYLTPGAARYDQRVRTSHQLVSLLRDLVPGIDEERLEQVRRAFCEQLGPDQPDAAIGLMPNLTASRIANRFNLRGPAYTIDAACASALLAVEHAAAVLRENRCDAMLVGAVHHVHHATFWSVFSQLRALSPSGRIRPFDRSADGTLPAEGTGMVVLKRLADAQRAGDRIYAVIRGVGSSSDGRASSLLSPLADGQVLALERAWQDSRLDPGVPGAVGLVEAHGTATPVGDQAELETLRRVFGPHGPPIGLGTVKSMIGHAMPAAGMAGLIKAACALHDGVLPPTLGIDDPHAALAGTRLQPIREQTNWERAPGAPRRAVVNAFGFGGVNAHVILEEPPGNSVHSGRTTRPPASLVSPNGDPSASVALALRELGEDEVILRLAAESAEKLAELLAVPDEELLTRVGQEPPELPCRLAMVSPTARRLKLARAIVTRGIPSRGRSDIWFTPRPLLAPGPMASHQAGGEAGSPGGRVAFLFPGFEPVFEPRIADVTVQLGLPQPKLTGRTDLLGQAADVIAVGRLLDTALRRLGVVPDVAAGHSLGEWTAMIAAGVYPQDAVDALITALDHDVLDVPDVAYAALGCGAHGAEEAIRGLEGVVVSHDNCPHQSVICGVPGAVRQVLARLTADGVLGQELPFRSGFHTPMAEAYLERVHALFETSLVRQPDVPLWSATTVAPFPEQPEQVRALIIRHLLEPVRFSALIERLYETGVRAFVQVGPGSLTGFVTDRLGGREHLAIAANVGKHDGLAQLRRAIAAFWVEGYVTTSHRTSADVEGRPATGRSDGQTGQGMRLDLGTRIVRLNGAVPPLTRPGCGRPEVPTDAPVLAEFDALLRDTTATADTVLNALGTPTQPTAEGGELTTSRVFSLETMPYLTDHCLVPQRANWPEPSDRFPVVPLTTLLEVMAEIARELRPGQVVIGFENIRAMRWVVAAPPTVARIHAQLIGPGRIEVKIEGHTDGIVLLAEHYPAAPPADRTPLADEKLPPVTAERLYSEGWMFHGPRYQGVVEISALAADGVRGRLASLSTPGALLDSAAQLSGVWIQVYGDKDQIMFPLQVERITWYGPLPPAGERLDATIWNRTVSGAFMVGDMELVRPDGSVWARVDGWTSHRFFTDGSGWRMRFAPEFFGLGEPQPDGWCLARKHWSDVSSRDLAMRRYLCAAERTEYHRLPPRDQASWLLGRIAVKDAIRQWLWERGCGPLFPAELTVRDDATGRPEVTGPITEPLFVSIAYTTDLGVALVRPASQPAAIHIESVQEPGDAVEDVVLAENEQALVGRLPGDRALTLTRLRAAKKVAAKAAGTGPPSHPRDFVVTAADGNRLLVATETTATAVESRLLDSHIVAWTVAAENSTRNRTPHGHKERDSYGI